MTLSPGSVAVRRLRGATLETQEQFARRMGTAVRTISRWETIQPPRGKAIQQLEEAAKEAHQPELAALFHRARLAELQFDPFSTAENI